MRTRLLPIFLIILIFSIVAGCNMPKAATPTTTAAPTKTKLPDTPTTKPTDTLPPPTETSVPSPTPFPTQPPPPPTAAQPSPTPKYPDAIVLYYINKEVKGPYGCNEALFYVNTGRAKSGNLIVDVTFALQRLFSFHGEYWGNLYNPYGASNFAVASVEQGAKGVLNVYLTGTVAPIKESCDRTRLIHQIRQTILLNFAGISNLNVYLNGAALGDALRRKQ